MSEAQHKNKATEGIQAYIDTILVGGSVPVELIVNI